MNEFTYWVNGKFELASEAVVPLNSRGYRLGDGVFDTERTFNGHLFRLEEHLERLQRSLRFTRMELGLSLQELAAVTEEAVERNRPLLQEYGDFWVTQTVHRVTGAPAFCSIIVEPLNFKRFAPFYRTGIPLVVPTARTSASIGMDPKLKATSRLNMVLADLEGKQIDADSLSVLVDDHGNLAEVLYGNLFLVHQGKVRTPRSRSILEGISRRTTLELAEQHGIEVREDDLQPYDLYVADEAFVTTTSYCLLPVGSLNGQVIGSVRPGPITQRLTQAWSEHVGLDFVAQMETYGGVAQLAPVATKAAVR